jgi:integrase
LKLTITKDKEQNKEIKRLAEIARSKREAQLFTGAWNLQDTSAMKTTLAAYLEELATSKEHTDYITGCIRYLKKYPGGAAVQLAQITPRWIEQFQNYLLKDTGLKPLTASAYSKAVRVALRKAVRDNILVKNPGENVKSLAEPKKKPVFLNADEIQKLADTEIPIKGTLGPEVRGAFLFACYTGLRISDIRTLTWADIVLDPPRILKTQEKTGDSVTISLNETAWRIIKDRQPDNPDEPVFPYLNTRSDTNRYLTLWAEAAGVTTHVSWHTARRTFATLVLENGADIYTVAKLLGHTGIGQVARYARVTDKLGQKAIDALPCINL